MAHIHFTQVASSLAAVLALTASALAQTTTPAVAAEATMPVAIRFAAAVGDKTFSCGDKYQGIGTAASTVQVTDFRFFASNVRLVRADGAEVPVALTQDGLWQNGGVALLDFEDATGTCVNGTPETRYVIEGTAPQGNYTGVRFALGLPFDVNHREVTLQPSPLNLSRMFWSWNAGYKFMRLDLLRERLHPDAAGAERSGGVPEKPDRRRVPDRSAAGQSLEEVGSLKTWDAPVRGWFAPGTLRSAACLQTALRPAS